MSTMKELDRSNSLADLAGRINEAHHLTMHHAGEAVGQAIACGEMLLEAKSKVGHGKWLPWLQQHVTFSERSAQGYMRLAKRGTHELKEGSTIRDALRELAIPQRHWREEFDAELRLWTAHSNTMRASLPEDARDWSLQDAVTCANLERGFSSIFHRHGVCVPEVCSTCHAEGRAAGKSATVADLE